MNTNKLRCIVLEDEDDIRHWLINKLKLFPELEIIGEATNVNAVSYTHLTLPTKA